jgi:two-component system chemotaxis response regulator CheY
MGPSVLIVDDVEFVRKTLGEIFRQARYRVVGEASDGQEALNLYAKLTPDLVTMDIVMPQMSGIEAIRKLMKLDKNAKVIIVSAMDQENLAMDAVNAGAKDYLLKPFSAKEVIRTAERVLAGNEPGSGMRPAGVAKG